jgi:branched-chain amino acid transport system ATP-binding protein
MLKVVDIHTYYGKSYVLHGVSLEVQPGEIVALLGRNGVGKTTTMKSIMGLVAPRRGQVYFDGRELTALPAYRVGRLGLGYVPQGRRIFPDLTVWENLCIGVARGTVTAEVLDRVFRYFPILAERRRQRGGTLSGGEQQMLAIARALVKQPAMLLMDEPSEGLAPLVVRAMCDTIRALNHEGLGILLAEQQVATALDLANRVYVMENGMIVFEGRAEELRRHQDLMLRYLGVVA